jgi:hypothetical protein
MHTLDPTLTVMAAAVLMVRAGIAKRKLSWRKAEAPRDRRRRR